MKQLLSILLLIIVSWGCRPVRHVNVQRKHNFYERHRYATYTTPMWIPGRGIILETYIIAPNKKCSKPLPHKGSIRK